MPCSNRSHLTFSRCADDARISHPIYSHDLSKNYRGTQVWGPLNYSLCTDSNGFKTACDATENSLKSFDIAFIGDSFTEGIGLEYEDTFIGQISMKLPRLKIANLGVSSYSPSIYYAKVKFLLEQGITFKQLVVYIDISDIQDEAVSRILVKDVVVPKSTVGAEIAGKFLRIKQLANWSFPLTYFGLHKLLSTSNDAAEQKNYLMADYARSAWTYNRSSSGYGAGGVDGGIEQSLRAMSNLSDLLKERGILLSVGVYPWPAQLLYDTSDSLQVRIWREFCETRCIKFYDSFSSFFALKEKILTEEIIEKYFIAGDVHHNRLGAQIIANDFLRSFKN